MESPCARSLRASLTVVLLVGLHVFAPGEAHAGGFEYGVPGARSLGRAGADVAGIDTPLALYYNPANLGRMERARATVDVNLGLYDICMRRELVGDPADYDPDDEAALAVPDANNRNFLPEVCNSGRPSIVPNFGVAIPIVDGLTLAAGIIVPVSAQVQQFGNVHGRRYVGERGPRGEPTPTRYIITKQDLLQLFGTIGLGYAPMDELRFGFAFGWGYTHAKFVNVAHAPLGDDGTDAPNYLDASDAFVPRFTISAATTPVPGLEIASSFTYVDDVRATGEVQVEFANLLLPSNPEDRIAVHLNAGQPWTFALGVRYADRLATPVGTVGDRLGTERWDVEMDLAIVGSARVRAFSVDLPDDASIEDLIDLPDALDIAHRWKNQVVLRVGGDYNPIPNVLGVRAGFSYESSGVTHGFEQVDFLPFQRVGLHVGTTLRIAQRFDISIAYAHLFQERTDVLGSYCAVSSARCLNRLVPEDDPPPARLVVANAGVITSSIDLVSLELDYAF